MFAINCCCFLGKRCMPIENWIHTNMLPCYRWIVWQKMPRNQQHSQGHMTSVKQVTHWTEIWRRVCEQTQITVENNILFLAIISSFFSCFVFNLKDMFSLTMHILVYIHVISWTLICWPNVWSYLRYPFVHHAMQVYVSFIRNDTGFKAVWFFDHSVPHLVLLFLDLYMISKFPAVIYFLFNNKVFYLHCLCFFTTILYTYIYIYFRLDLLSYNNWFVF